MTRLKIDQSFVRKITNASPPEDTAIVRSIIVMAHNLGLEVIAEGVETAAQANFLTAEKCEELQVYLFAKPLAAVEIERYLWTNAANRVATELAVQSPLGVETARPAAILIFIRAILAAACVNSTPTALGR
jgi:predicted signal transduction protein with EAL and GGDEF domain